MKNTLKKLQYILLGTVLLFMLPGCLDIYFTTEIKTNGEIFKTLVMEGDSTEITQAFFPFMNDETWDREWIYIDKDKSKLVLSKKFKNAKQAALDLNPADSMPYIRFQPELKKKFRWFFSYYEYTENLLATNPFTKLDWKDYFSESEIKLILMDEDERESDPLYDKLLYGDSEKKFEDYILGSAFEEFFQLFTQALKNTKGIDLTAEDLLVHKKELYDLAIQAEDNDDVEAILNILRGVFDSEDITKIGNENKALLGYFDKKLEFFDGALDDNFSFTIRMPGLLINTNSNQIEGNSLAWELDFFDAYFQDYPMTAESRVVNTWAFVVAGLALAFLLISGIWRAFRRKKD